MSRVLANGLKIRAGPSTSSENVHNEKYNSGDIINSGEAIIHNDNRYWLKYNGASGNKRYVCAWDIDGTKLIDIPLNIPGPRPGQIDNKSETGIPGIPKQNKFPNDNIKQSGCCFLSTCVKGGLSNMNQCLDCYNWCLQSGKIRADCWVSVNKEDLAKQISQKYNTPFHGDYCFQTNDKRSHFWLTQNGKEIFNSNGIGHH